MTDNKKLIEAVKTLKNNCENNYAEPVCDCIFADGEECDFPECPKYWEIPKLRRFTSKDIALAKALKAFGQHKFIVHIIMNTVL